MAVTQVIYVDLITDLVTLPTTTDPEQVCIVRDIKRTGGNPFSWSSTLPANITMENNGTVYKALSGYWIMQFEGPINVEWFITSGSSPSDVHSGIQKALTFASKSDISNEVYLPQGTFIVDQSLWIQNGVRSFYGPGKLLLNSSSVIETVIYINGILNTNMPPYNTVVNFRLAISEIDGGGKARNLVKFNGNNTDILVENILFRNPVYPQDVTDSANAVFFGKGCANCTITNNKIYLPIITTDTYPNITGIGLIGESIKVGSTTELTFDGNYFANNGIPILPTYPVFNNIVTNNTIDGGSYGVLMTNCVRNTIEGNICLNQKARGVNCSQASFNNLIIGNSFSYFGSSGVALGYNVHFNKVANNYVYSNNAQLEGAIQAYCGCTNNIIENNYINANSFFGIYLGIGASDNVVSKNQVYGYRLAGIAIESDWNDIASFYVPASRPAFNTMLTAPKAYFSSPQRVSPIAAKFPGIFKWPFNDCINNIIQANIIGISFIELSQTIPQYQFPTAALYLSAIPGFSNPATSTATYGVINTLIIDNIITTTTATNFNLFIYDYNLPGFTSEITNIEFNNNNFANGSGSNFYFGNNRNCFAEIENNSILNNGVVAINTATPNVSIGDTFICTFTANTMITSLIGGSSGQEIIIKLDVFVGMNQSGNIVLKANIAMASANANRLISLKFFSGTPSGKWFETSRNF